MGRIYLYLVISRALKTLSYQIFCGGEQNEEEVKKKVEILYEIAGFLWWVHVI